MRTCNARSLIVGFATLAYTLNVIATFGIARNLLVLIWPTVIDALNITYADAGLITSTHHFFYLIASALGGSLIARARPVPTAAGTFLAIAVLTGAISFALSLHVLLIIYGSLGALIALNWIVLVRLANQRLSEAESAVVLSISVCGTAVGFSFGGGISGGLLARFGVTDLWIVAGGVIAIIGLIVFAALRLLPDAPQRIETKDSKIDHGPDRHDRSKIRIFYVISFLFGFCIIGVQVYLSSSVLVDRKIAQDLAGIVWILFGIGGLLSGLFLSAIVRVLGVVAAIAIALVGASMSLPALTFGQSGAVLFVGAFVFGLCSFGIFGLLPVGLGKVTAPDRHIIHYGRANFFVGLGSLSTSAIGGVMRDHFGSFAIYWVMLTFGLLLAAVLMHVLRRAIA